MKITIKVNGKNYKLEVNPLRRLVDILRVDLGLKGTKEGCGEGECGACTILLNGRAVTSCIVPAFQVDNSEIITIEGLGTSEKPSLLQQAFIEEDAIQCGFCTPGMIMMAQEILTKYTNPDREQIRKGLSGNLCRCTGYEKIFKAVEKAAYCQNISSRNNKT